MFLVTIFQTTKIVRSIYVNKLQNDKQNIKMPGHLVVSYEQPKWWTILNSVFNNFFLQKFNYALRNPIVVYINKTYFTYNS